jgi:hypothetical protein
MVISPRLQEIIEGLIKDDPRALDAARGLDATGAFVLADLERKLKALRETFVKEELDTLSSATKRDERL